MRPILLVWAAAFVACATQPAHIEERPREIVTVDASIEDAGAREQPRDVCAGDSFGLSPNLEAEIAARFEKKRGTMGTATKQIVATSNAHATEAGLAMLRSGGNAADAFVAAALVDDVVFPGVTSTAGLTGVLVYDAKHKRVVYVHGGLADAIDPARRWQSGDTAIGKKVLVPGAPAAYAELVKIFGKKSLASVVEPAAKLATDGFEIDSLYAHSIAGNRAKLETSDYGKRVFFRNGDPLKEGETLKQDELGKTLRSFGKNPNWFYKGAWPKEAVALVQKNGGALLENDFATYSIESAPPMHGRFRGYDLYAAGHGGVKVLTSLEAYDLLRGPQAAVSAPSSSADQLEMLLRVERTTNELPMLHDRNLVRLGLNDEAISKTANDVATRVREKAGKIAESEDAGTHSSAVIVVDAEGNIVVGTHTIETLNWGEGLFVGGVPLSTAGPHGFDNPSLAENRMRIDPLTATIVMKDGAPVAALTVYGTGLHPADVQILDGLLARNLDAETAVLEPRVGYFAFDAAAGKINFDENSVDPRFGPALLCELKKRGFKLTRSMPGWPVGYVDTGFPTLVTIKPGELHGMTPDMPFIHGLAKGD